MVICSNSHLVCILVTSAWSLCCSQEYEGLQLASMVPALLSLWPLKWMKKIWIINLRQILLEGWILNIFILCFKRNIFLRAGLCRSAAGEVLKPLIISVLNWLMIYPPLITFLQAIKCGCIISWACACHSSSITGKLVYEFYDVYDFRWNWNKNGLQVLWCLWFSLKLE